MIQPKMRWNIRGVSPFQKKARKTYKRKTDDKVDVCLNCEETDCKRGYCEKFGRSN